MKKAFLTLSLFLLASGSISFAANQESGSVSFPSAVQIGKDTLPAGVYKIHWVPGSNNTQVTISGSGHEISIPAKLVQGSGPDAVDTHTDGNRQVVDGFRVKSNSFTIQTP